MTSIYICHTIHHSKYTHSHKSKAFSYCVLANLCELKGSLDTEARLQVFGIIKLCVDGLVVDTGHARGKL